MKKLGLVRFLEPESQGAESFVSGCLSSVGIANANANVLDWHGL